MAKIQDKPYNVYKMEATLAYTDTVAKLLFELPKDAKITSIEIYTASTAAGGTADIGTLADDDYFVAAVDVSAVGTARCNLLVSDWFTAPTDIYGLQLGAIAGGPFTVHLEYISRKSRKIL